MARFRGRGVATLAAGISISAAVVGTAAATGSAPAASARTASARTARAPKPPPILTIAGNGHACDSAPACGDGRTATAAHLNFPEAVAVDATGDVYVADWGDNELRRVGPDGSITTVAGNGTACSTPPDCGDGGAATSASLGFPQGVAVDPAGDAFVADTGDDEVRMISPTGVITRIAGNGTPCSSPPSCGDGGPATSAQLNAPGGVAVDSAGNLYIADTGDNEVRVVSRGGTITTVAGNGTLCSNPSSCGDGAAATSAQLNFPQAVALGPHHRLYIADDGDNKVRVVTGGSIATAAGTGSICASPPSCGDGGPATKARLSFPEALAVDGGGNVYIADWGDNEVRVVSRSGTITTVAGNGTACSSPPSCGDGGPATSAPLNFPDGVAVDRAGDIYIGDTDNHELRWVPRRRVRPGYLSARGRTIAVVTFAAETSRTTVTVRYAVSGRIPITLSVTDAHGHRTTIGHGTARAGLNEMAWNRHLGRRRAPRGRYTLTITATAGGSAASSGVRIRL